MGKWFSDAVEEALKYIYYDVRAGKGAEGLKLLKQASDAGDGDASCILARCYGGRAYMWNGHNFPEDDDLFFKYIHKSVEQGSALGVLVSMRCGEFDAEMERKMPFQSLEEAFQVVLKKAEEGEAFCQYTIGNTYYWLDFMEIQGKSRESFGDIEEFRTYVRENYLKCEEWFRKAMQGGVNDARNNLNKVYIKGGDGLAEPRPELAKDLYKEGAKMGHPDSQWTYANQLERNGDKKEALYWYKQAAEGGQFECWYAVGQIYMEGKEVPKDVNYAVECYEKALKQITNTKAKIACAAKLGWMYCEGAEIPQNGEKAFPLLKLAVDNGDLSRVTCLGKCYFQGWGTVQDYEKARECFERANTQDQEAKYWLGIIYTQGLGVAEDIGKGVQYLMNAGNFPGAAEELAKYKKRFGFFGKWVRK